MLNLDIILPAARQLRIAATAREADRDDSEAEHDARMAFVALAMGMEMHIDADRPPRWSGLAALAMALELAAHSVAKTRVDSFDLLGPVVALTLVFGQVARAIGYRAEPAIRMIDDTARDSVEGYQEAAE